MQENFELPDSIQPILAVRAWNIISEQDRYFLASCHQNNLIWPVSTELSAICTVNDPWGQSGIKHSAPILDCECGIYALKQMPGSAGSSPWESDSVLGLAFLWGRIIEGTLGYRAQFCKPAALLDDGRAQILNSLSETYSIPLVSDLNISRISLHFES